MIHNIKLYKSFNFWGDETLEVKIFTENGEYTANVPAGTSKGKAEAKSVPFRKAKQVFSEIRSQLIAKDENDWRRIEAMLLRMDGTENFSNIGGNLALALGIAAAKAATGNKLWKITGRFPSAFPCPLSNMIGGGKHHGHSDWQEFLLLPARAKSPAEALKIVVDAWKVIGEELKEKKILLGRNLENAWMAGLDNFKTLDFLSDIAADYNMKIGIDFAASSFWTGKGYKYKTEKKTLSKEGHFNLVLEAAKKYRIYYLEDPFHENDFKSFRNLTEELGKKALVVGDDIYSTNPKRLGTGIKNSSSNGIIIKPNQIGSLNLTERVVEIAKRNSITIIPSHRSRETHDTWLSDLAVAWEAPLIKISATGADIPKHNRLIELWEEIPNARMSDLPL